MLYLGIDTSNYTTSAALVSEDGRVIADSRLPVTVGDGERGIRQSDAVFTHIKNLPVVLDGLCDIKELGAVGVSYAPRDIKGSYMPCFLSGVAAAKAAAVASGANYFEFSHQAGHIAAAVCTAGREDLLNEKFLAFHVSGGTTDLLLCDRLEITQIGGTLDLNAGQLIDRVGVMLGLKFPCGKELEEIALPLSSVKPYSCVKETSCNLSGLENKASDMLKRGESREYIAAFTLASVKDTLDKMCKNALSQYGDLPVVFAGGVTANKYIKDALSAKYNAIFTLPEYSRDNAVGTAYLTRKKALGI